MSRISHTPLLTFITSAFPIFGATAPSIASLPLVFIISVTAIKDAIEDYRRAQVDEELNTTATTKLGNWKNVNQPTDPRNWLERALGLNPPGRVTKGVRKLRDRDAGEGMRIMLRRGDESRVSFTSEYKDAQSSMSLDMRPTGPGGRVRLADFNAALYVTPGRPLAGNEVYSRARVGSEPYIAWETSCGAWYGKAVDWWALGCLVFDMLFGSVSTPAPAFSSRLRSRSFAPFPCP